MRRHSTGFGLALLTVLLVGAALRVWRLAELPPGLWFDEAVNGVDARMVLSGQGLPVYFAANFGREPLFIYLQALAMALLGPTPVTLRAVSVFVGVLTLPATFFAASRLFRPHAAAKWSALLAAAVLAVSYWHVSLSRLGLRTVLLPLVSALAVTAFWTAWHGHSRRAWVWTGVLFGLAFYTYTSARLLPLVPALFILTELIFEARRVRRDPAWHGRGVGLAIAALVGLLILLPLGIEAIRNPAVVLGRSGDIVATDQAAGGSSLARNALAVARAFYDRGDANVRHNLPGRPATDLLTAVLFSVGWLAALVGMRRSENRLLLIWLAAMLLPTVLSGEAPHYLRASGALIPHALLAALGGQTLTRFLPTRFDTRALALLTPAVLLVGAVLTAVDYFVRWPASPDFAQKFSVAEQQAAEAVRDRLQAGAPLLLPHALYGTPNFLYTLWPVSEVSGPPPNAAQAERVRTSGAEPAGATPSGGPDWIIWRTSEGVRAAPVMPDDPTRSWAPSVPLDLTFTNGLRLIGYDVKPDVSVDLTSGQPVTLTLYWALAPEHERAGVLASEVFAHLIIDGAVAATDNGPIVQGAYRTAWPALAGLLVDVHQFEAPVDSAGEKAFFEVGLYARRPFESYAQAQRIQLLDGNGNVAGNQVNVAPVMIADPPPTADLTGLTPGQASFEDRISLVGWQVTPTGDAQALARLCWRADARMPTNLTAFVHLLGPADGTASQFDTAPGGPDNPTSRWVPGETVCTQHPLSLTGLAPNESPRLRVGLYEPVSGRQLAVSGGGAPSGATYLILAP